MDFRKRLQRLTKLRFAILYPFIAFVVIFCTPSDISFREGVWFLIAGLLIRVWANLYAIKMDKLTTSGPYAFVRHPLYLGTTFIGIGFVVILKIPVWGLFLFFTVLGTVYYLTIKKEEHMLESKFSEFYRQYKKHVWAFLPRITPYRSGEKWKMSFERFLRSKEYKTLIWVTVILIGFYFKEEIPEGEGMSSSVWLAGSIALLLILVDLASIWIIPLIFKKYFNSQTKSPSVTT